MRMQDRTVCDVLVIQDSTVCDATDELHVLHKIIFSMIFLKQHYFSLKENSKFN